MMFITTVFKLNCRFLAIRSSTIIFSFKKCILKGMIIYFLDISIVLMSILQGSTCINCFKCSSWNGSNANCEDPFNPAMSSYIEKCMVPKRGHVGMFPANFCTKIIGKNVVTHEIMVIRQCAMKTMDSQCGEFKYQDHTMNGCILTCDFDGCNSGQIKKPNKILQITLSVFVLVFTSYYVNVFKLLRVTIIMNI